jgi:hypothetical protein
MSVQVFRSLVSEVAVHQVLLGTLPVFRGSSVALQIIETFIVSPLARSVCFSHQPAKVDDSDYRNIYCFPIGQVGALQPSTC